MLQVATVETLTHEHFQYLLHTDELMATSGSPIHTSKCNCTSRDTTCGDIGFIYQSGNTRLCYHMEMTKRRRHFTDVIFKNIFLNKNVWISLNISQKFASKVRINNIPALVQIMVWRRLGDKPLSEPVMVRLYAYTLICVTRSKWVNLLRRGYAYIRHW